MSLAQFLKKQIWNAKRFGIWPDKLVGRLTSRPRGKGICITVPKSGTHLLERALCLHPGLYRRILPTLNRKNIDRYGGIAKVLESLGRGQLLFCHMSYREEMAEAIRANGVQAFICIRDPRDVAVSNVFHIMRHRDHIQHEFFAGLGDFRERLATAIQGAPEHGQLSIAQIFDHYSGWLDSDDLIVRFEDLVGERGGGDSTRQANLLKRIFASLGIDLSEDEVRRISNSVFSDVSPTFRKGVIGGWREHFDPEIAQMFKAVASEQLIRFGYETDSDW